MKASPPALVFNLVLALSSALFAAPAPDQDAITRHYEVAFPPMPEGIDPQVGGLAVLPDGNIIAAFHQGEVAVFDIKRQSWKLFAQGLHEPLGILPDADGSVLVMQRPELTRLRDSDNDGVADSYESLWTDFGMSGNYHEFAFGPARGPDGKLYVGLNLASNGDGIRKEIRGAWSPIGVPLGSFYSGNWKAVAGKVGRMYSRVAWRGWVMQIDPKTGVGIPFASGLRSPDGLGFDTTGNLWVSDNQGDWRGTSELHVIKKDGFYGHPASLVWRKDWDGSDPLKAKIERLNQLRTPAAIWFPHNIYANSPTQPVCIPKTPAWGAFGGQMLIGEMNSPRLLRVLSEQVDGVWQGAIVNLIDLKSLKGGLHRLAFNGDTLWIGRTHLSWAGGDSIATLRPKAALPFDPLDIHVTPTGFRIEFTEPLASSASDPAKWAILHYSYAYHSTYGSPQMEKAADVPAKVTLSNGNKTAEVTFAGLKENFIYDFDLTGIVSASGSAPLNPKLAYTLRKLPKP